MIQPGRSREGSSEHLEHPLDLGVTLRDGTLEQPVRDTVVTRDPAPVHVHPPERELGLGVACPRRFAVQRSDP